MAYAMGYMKRCLDELKRKETQSEAKDPPSIS